MVLAGHNHMNVRAGKSKETQPVVGLLASTDTQTAALGQPIEKGHGMCK
jgi:hypothetical protein